MNPAHPAAFIDHDDPRLLLAGDELLRLLEVRIPLHEHHLGGHDVAHQGIARRQAGCRHAGGDVPVGEGSEHMPVGVAHG